MKSRIPSIFWGVVLILAGGLFLANQLGYFHFDEQSPQLWIFVFAAASLLFLVSYLLNGVQNWGWLFPTAIFAAIALTIGLTEAGVDNAVVGAPIMAGIALPFWVGYALERKRWGLLIPAWILTALTLVTAMADVVRGEWIGALVLFAIGLPFLVVYLRDRSKRWALIPAWVLIVLALVTLLSAYLQGEWIGALVLFAIGLPFLVVYLRDRSKRWALIPSWVLFVLAFVTLSSTFAQGEWIGALVMYAIGLPFLVVFLLDRNKRWALIPAAALGVLGTIQLLVSLFGENDVMGGVIMLFFALPFFLVYFWSQRNWWALIPAGILASIGVVAVLAPIVPWRFEGNDPILTGVLLLGFGLTFGGLWLRRASQPTAWALYPAAGLIAAALLAFALVKRFDQFWPIAILLAGILMIVLSLVGPKGDSGQAKPESKG